MNSSGQALIQGVFNTYIYSNKDSDWKVGTVTGLTLFTNILWIGDLDQRSLFTPPE